MGNKKLDAKFIEFQGMSEQELQEKESLLEALDYDKLRENLMKTNIEPIQKDVENRKKEINGRIAQLTQQIEQAIPQKQKARIFLLIEALKEEKETLDISIDEKKQMIDKEIIDRKRELNYVKGYQKNKDQINKIMHYKNGIQTKLNRIIIEKVNLEKEKEGLKELIEKQKNQKLEELDNNQYNKHFENIDNLKKIEEKLKEIEKKEMTYKSMISKCDLAWKTLFSNKTWEDIQVRATRGKYTNKGQQKSGLKETNKDEFKEKHPFLAKIRNLFKRNRNEITSEWKEEPINSKQDNKDTQIVEYDEFREKHPLLAKVRDLIKKGRKEQKEEQISNNSKNEPKEEKNVNTKRDAFLEELRVMVEQDGKLDKENAYKEMHKQKDKKAIEEVER